jgi:hypothetical protein
MRPGGEAMRKLFRRFGTAIQIIFLGEALFWALVTLYAMQANARVFRYAGF